MRSHHLQSELEVVDVHVELQEVPVKLRGLEVEQIVGAVADVLHNPLKAGQLGGQALDVRVLHHQASVSRPLPSAVTLCSSA